MLGATLVAISPQLQKHSQAIVQERGLTFDVLADPGNRVAGEFGLVFELPEDMRAQYRSLGFDLETYNGDGSWTLPLPARYIISRDAIIRDAATAPDYTVRPDPTETLGALRKLTG